MFQVKKIDKKYVKNNRMLPNDMLEEIANYSDIDIRRYMGLKPRKINKDILTKMNLLIERKHNSIYTEYDNEIVSLFPKDETTMYLTYNYQLNYVNIIYMTGISRCLNRKVIYT